MGNSGGRRPPTGIREYRSQFSGCDIPLTRSKCSGGGYSTTHDLSRLARKILNPKTNLLPQEKINVWLKPIPFGTRTADAVGFPWEIRRTAKLTSAKSGLTTDIYAKEGAI